MAIKLKGHFDKSKALKNLANKDKLTPHLIKASTEEFPWEFKFELKQHDDAWHPSGDCTPTVEELYYHALRTEEEHEESRKEMMHLLRHFQVGHFWHQYMQQLVLRLGFAEDVDIEREGWIRWGTLVDGKAKPYHWARGFADVAPCVIPRHGEYVVDFKTMNTFDFKKTNLPDWVAHKYEAQLNVYMDFFDLEKGLIVCIQKDSPHELKEFEFRRDPELVRAIYDKWAYVSVLLEDEDPPNQLELAKEFKLPFTGPVE